MRARPTSRPTGGRGRSVAAAGIVLLAGACAPGDPWQQGLGDQHPLAGRIYQVATDRFVDRATLLADLGHAHFVLLGERPGNLDHPRLLALLTEELQARSARPRPVVFEMIPSDRQLALVEYRQQHPGDAAGLGAAVGWADLGWPDWALYAPIAEAALERDAEIVAGGLSPADREAVFQDGPTVLQAPMVRRTGLDRDLPAALASSLAKELRAAQCGPVAEPVVEGMMRVRRASEAMMADRLATVAGRAGGILIAGNGHVRADRGVPWYLARIRPDARTLSVGLIEVFDGAEGGPAGLPLDYVWFTPWAGDQPPCTDAGPLPHRVEPALGS